MITTKKIKPKTRNGLLIKKWLLRNGMTQAEIVLATGLNKGLVSKTVNGIRNCRKVLDYLASKGTPEKLLWKGKRGKSLK